MIPIHIIKTSKNNEVPSYAAVKKIATYTRTGQGAVRSNRTRQECIGSLETVMDYALDQNAPVVLSNEANGTPINKYHNGNKVITPKVLNKREYRIANRQMQKYTTN